MKFVASFLTKFSPKGADARQDIFDQRLSKMMAPMPASKNRRARTAQMPSAFRARPAMAH